MLTGASRCGRPPSAINAVMGEEEEEEQEEAVQVQQQAGEEDVTMGTQVRCSDCQA